MFKKTLTVCTVYILCCAQSALAQASFKCYVPGKIKPPANWMVGMRTGIGQDQHNDYLTTQLFKNIDWVQQVFL